MHLGITGEDLVREMIPDADQRVVLIDGLGFGFANVVVAVPQAWIDVRSMADLDDVATAFRLKHDRKMRVATKYVNLTRDFFAAHGIVDYRIVESSGATEGAPAAGTAELIVDITTTGATLAANGLKVIDDGVILRSQANLVAARARRLGRGASARPRACMLDRIAAQERARAYPRGAHALCRLRRRAARRSARGALRRRRAVRRADLVRHADAALPAASRCTRWRASCASTAPRRSSVAELDYVFARDNPLYERLVAELDRDVGLPSKLHSKAVADPTLKEARLPNANDPTVHARRDERPQGVIAYLTIDDGRGLNVMSSAVMDALAAALVALASDEDLRAVVLSGAGAKAFSAGADIKEMAAIENPQEAKALITRLHRCCDAIRNLPVPVIARIHGYLFRRRAGNRRGLRRAHRLPTPLRSACRRSRSAFPR